MILFKLFGNGRFASVLIKATKMSLSLKWEEKIFTSATLRNVLNPWERASTILQQRWHDQRLL